MSNIVAIVGRPNVGKSTLFNRLIEKKKAIMDNESGVTRDKNYGYGEWIGKYFTVIDTGGYVTGSQDKFEKEIRKQVEMALEECDIILFLVDAKTGITGGDQEFAHVLRGSKKPVLVVPNKADNSNLLLAANEFYGLGLSDKIFPISSASGSGTGELLDELVSHFQEEGKQNPDEGIPRIAILGRPNVGKSSFVNSLLGKERSIVTDEAGTTRDALNTRYKLFGKDFILVDTAGVRKKAKVKGDIEFYSVLRSLQALQDSDVCIIMVDATRGLEAQDVSLMSMAARYYKGIVVMVNKWDLIEKDTHTSKAFIKDIHEKIAPMTWVPIFFTSVVEKKRIFQVIEKAVEVYGERRKAVSTSKLNAAMLPEIEHYPPPAIKGKHIKIKYITQIKSRSPAFAFFCNMPQYIKEPYQRYLENKMRDHFNFEGVPIRIFFRKK